MGGPKVIVPAKVDSSVTEALGALQDRVGSFGLAVLAGLQNREKHVYQGTVPRAVAQRRHARAKAGRRAARGNRGR